MSEARHTDANAQPQPGRFFAAALQALDAGLASIPIKPNRKRPLIEWREYQDHPPTEAEIEAWAQQWPDANIAIVTGKASGVTVIDLDEGHGPWPPEGCELPAHYVVATPNNGHHYYFPHIEGVVNSAGKLAKGVDVRGDGGYVLVPPSTIDKKFYRVVFGSLNQLQDAPDWLRKSLLNGHVGKDAKALPLPGTILQGTRNSQLASLAGSMRRRGIEAEEISAALKTVNEQRCNPPLPDTEIENIANSISKYEPARNNGRSTEGHRPPTDFGNAERLVDRHGEDIRHCSKFKTWFAWNGQRWLPVEDDSIRYLAAMTARSIYQETLDCDEKAQRDNLAKWASTSESAKHIKAAVELAKTLPGIGVEPGRFDTDEMLLNCANGTIDLRTGTLREHSREDFITKMVPVDYDPEAECPEFLRFLHRVMNGDDDLVTFLQRALGYSLTGRTTERIVLILHGTGANGKSTFISAVKNAMGDYADTISSETLMVQPQGKIRNDLAALKGLRFAAASESPAGRRLDEASIKQMAGGCDEMRARRLYQEPFTFIVTHKVWLATNHKPVIRGTDKAIWDRIRLVPFTVRIPEGEQDKELPRKLIQEGAGILAWMVEGCVAWQQQDQTKPAAVVQATDDYRSEMDQIGAFMEDCCVLHADNRETVGDVYRAYSDWCHANAERAMPKQAFGRCLRERGFEQPRTSKVRFWKGIGLVREEGFPDGGYDI